MPGHHLAGTLGWIQKAEKIKTWGRKSDYTSEFIKNHWAENDYKAKPTFCLSLLVFSKRLQYILLKIGLTDIRGWQEGKLKYKGDK